MPTIWRLASTSKRIKLLEEAKKNPNPYLQRISQSQNLDEQLKNSKTELENLKAKGFAPLKDF